jgi:hypothetical protein
MKDFQNPVQATEDKRSQFLSWSQAPEAVKLRLQGLPMHELGPANSGAKRMAKLANVETAVDNLRSAQKGIASENWC